MKVGDLVRYTGKPDLQFSPHVGTLGIVMRIDIDHYGARQAYKIVGAERGHCLHPKMVNAITATAEGIRDRILVLWSNPEIGWDYCETTEIEVISESR